MPVHAIREIFWNQTRVSGIDNLATELYFSLVQARPRGRGRKLLCILRGRGRADGPLLERSTAVARYSTLLRRCGNSKFSTEVNF